MSEICGVVDEDGELCLLDRGHHNGAHEKPIELSADLLAALLEQGREASREIEERVRKMRMPEPVMTEARVRAIVREMLTEGKR